MFSVVIVCLSLGVSFPRSAGTGKDTQTERLGTQHPQDLPTMGGLHKKDWSQEELARKDWSGKDSLLQPGGLGTWDRGWYAK